MVTPHYIMGVAKKALLNGVPMQVISAKFLKLCISKIEVVYLRVSVRVQLFQQPEDRKRNQTNTYTRAMYTNTTKHKKIHAHS